jgi:peptidoglycan/xylan/chitin deacetylase (PgdA/CDA1 family)
MPRWSWDFEDERPAGEPTRAAAPARAPTQPPAGHDDGQPQIRRRRGIAVVVVLLLIAVGIAALSGSHGSHAKAHSVSVATPAVASTPKTPEESPRAGEAAVRSVLAYTPFVKEGGTSGHDVALTFDDGPGPYTPQVLDVLERFHVRATFFEIGKMLRYFGSSTMRQLDDGDVIGDHTESHPAMETLSRHDQHEELFEQILRAELLGAHRPVLFRPPYGSFDATTMRVLHSLHLLMVLWSVDTDDYLRPGVPVIVHRALEGVHPGAIILMHDAGGDRTQTIAALPAIIRGIRARGYRLVTVPQLLKDDPPPEGEPLPPSLAGD